MAAHKKEIKRDQFIPIRVSRKEKRKIEEDGMVEGMNISEYIRMRLGLERDIVQQ